MNYIVNYSKYEKGLAYNAIHLGLGRERSRQYS